MGRISVWLMKDFLNFLLFSDRYTLLITIKCQCWWVPERVEEKASFPSFVSDRRIRGQTRVPQSVLKILSGFLSLDVLQENSEPNMKLKKDYSDEDLEYDTFIRCMKVCMNPETQYLLVIFLAIVMYSSMYCFVWYMSISIYLLQCFFWILNTFDIDVVLLMHSEGKFPVI